MGLQEPARCVLVHCQQGPAVHRDSSLGTRPCRRGWGRRRCVGARCPVRAGPRWEGRCDCPGKPCRGWFGGAGTCSSRCAGSCGFLRVWAGGVRREMAPASSSVPGEVSRGSPPSQHGLCDSQTAVPPGCAGLFQPAAAPPWLGEPVLLFPVTLRLPGAEPLVCGFRCSAPLVVGTHKVWPVWFSKPSVTGVRLPSADPGCLVWGLLFPSLCLVRLSLLQTAFGFVGLQTMPALSVPLGCACSLPLAVESLFCPSLGPFLGYLHSCQRDVSVTMG